MKHSVRFVCCLACLLVPSIASGIERPELLGNYLKLNTGEYLYAEDDPSLDFRLRNNFAVQFWFKLESVPEIPSGQRVLLLKPGSYAFVILAEVVIENKDGVQLKRNIPALYIMSRTEEGGGFDVGVLGGIKPGEWHHFAFETWREGNVRRAASYYNGEKGHGPENIRTETWYDDTDSRFYIGDVPRETIESLTEIDLPYTPFISRSNLLWMKSELSLCSPVGKPQTRMSVSDTESRGQWRYGTLAKDRMRRSTMDSAGEPIRYCDTHSPCQQIEDLATTWGRLKSHGF